MTAATHDLHICCDALESAYVSVAYVHGTDYYQGQIHIVFVLETMKQESMAHLELCATLTGTQLAQF